MTDLRAIPSADLVAAADTALLNSKSYWLAVRCYADQAARWDAQAVVSMATGQASQDTERIEQAAWATRQAEAAEKLAKERLIDMAITAAQEATYRLELARRRDLGIAV